MSNHSDDALTFIKNPALKAWIQRHYNTDPDIGAINVPYDGGGRDAQGLYPTPEAFVEAILFAHATKHGPILDTAEEETAREAEQRKHYLAAREKQNEALRQKWTDQLHEKTGEAFDRADSGYRFG